MNEQTQQNNQNEIFFLGWLDPRDETILPAGVAFYNEEYGEFFLKIDEEPFEKQYFLKPYTSNEDKVKYHVELVIKNKGGKFLKRQKVGYGVKDANTEGRVHMHFGSKYKTLVLALDK